MGRTICGYAFRSRIGLLRIMAEPNGWTLWLDDLRFDGPFATAQHALDDLAGGHCYWPTTVDTSTLGLPEEVSGWSPILLR
jgi:hypothetical protein